MQGDRDTGELEALLDERVPVFADRVRSLAATRSKPASQGAAYGWNHGMRGLQSAIDHLEAWRTISHSRPRRVMAHYSLLRAAIDGTARARWLFDPLVSPAVRAGRGYRSAMKDYEELVKVEKLDRSDEATGEEELDPLLQAVWDEADAEGVAIAGRKKSGYTELAARYGGWRSRQPGSGAYLYSILSAAAHGHVWAEHLARGAVLRAPGREDRSIRIMDVDAAFWVTGKALDIVERAIRDAETHAARGEPGSPITATTGEPEGRGREQS